MHVDESSYRLLYGNFYCLSSPFALESFLSSQCTSGNIVLREVSVFHGICLFLLGSKEKPQKWQEQNTGSAKHFMLCSISSSFFFFPVLKSSAPANEGDQVSQLCILLDRLRDLGKCIYITQVFTYQ